MTYSGPPNPKMLMVGEAWGADEDSMRLPLVGTSGKENWKMLGEALPDVYPELHAQAMEEILAAPWGLAWIGSRDPWLHAAGIGFTNVLNARPPNNDLKQWCAKKADLGPTYPYPPLSMGQYLRPEFFHHLKRLHEEVQALRPNVVVLMGNTACWAFLQKTAITSLRGTTQWSHKFGVKCLPTFHPASLLYEGQWKQRPVIIADYMKAYRESGFPEIRRPKRSVLVNPTLQEVRDWIGRTLAKRPPYLAVDLETSGGMIDTAGFASSPSDALVVPFGPHRVKKGNNYVLIKPQRDGKLVNSYWSFEEEREVWWLIVELLSSSIPKLFQNGMYDLQYLLKMGIAPTNCLHDTMLAWHSLYPELPKSLGFLGSILTNDIAWKTFRSARSDSEKRDE